MNALAEKEPKAMTKNARVGEGDFLPPEVNIFETKDSYVIEAEMPGVTKDGLEVTLEGNLLTFVGHRNAETPKANVLYRESKTADFRRAFELDPAIDTTRIAAKMEQGVLTLQLPKAERVKPRKISVSD